MSTVQIEIYNAFRAIGMGETHALKAAAALTRRRDRSEVQANIQAFKWLLAASVCAAAISCLAA